MFGQSQFIRLLVLSLLMLFANQATSTDTPLEWSNAPDLPEKAGLGGPLVGVHRGALIVAGGSNFPGAPPWRVGDVAPGMKVWHDRIYVLEPEAEEWIDAGLLPRSWAYAPCAATDEGIYVLGGEVFDTVNHASAEVLLLRWVPASKQVLVTTQALPPLPKPSQYHSAAVIDNVIYVVASHSRSSFRLDEKSFWSLDLNKPAGERKWQSLEAWPGKPREKMVVAVQSCNFGDDPSAKCLYLFSGENWSKNSAGQYDLSQFEFYTDAYCYHPGKRSWKRIADLPHSYASSSRENGYSDSDFHGGSTHHLPRPVAAGSGINIGDSKIQIYSGSTGRSLNLEIQNRPEFPRDVLDYDTRTDSWATVGQMPIGVVTTSAVEWNKYIVIPSGEVRPGMRTNVIQMLKLSDDLTQ